MKPARGSARSSTQRPKGGSRGGRGFQQQSQKPLPNDRSTQDKSSKSSVSAVAGKAQKGQKLRRQENWKPLSKSNIAAIDNVLGLSILSVLTMRRKEKEESQKHLNLLKDQFLAKCAQLPVPSRKSENMMQVSQQFQEERQKINHGKKKLQAYEESSREVLSKLEQLQGTRDILEDKCRIMRDKLETEEENAQEVRTKLTQLSEQAVLRLPALPTHSDDDPTLQEQMMRMVPNPKAVMKAPQNSKVTWHVNNFLEMAHKQADLLLTHPVTTDSGDSVL
ncbi:centromere protein Q isoform X2 [Colossoma macropomum]|uniref:centromere protein Q isoform X2 n=1 Tax=Colossoma macropomum TaxID=42526 RepID=UPI001864445B|nr:centromere protein Q isoform X2 [Colossoma macropomum]